MNDGQYYATIEGDGRGIRARAASPEQAVAALSAAIGQSDEVGIALRAYALGGEDLMRRTIAEGRIRVPLEVGSGEIRKRLEHVEDQEPAETVSGEFESLEWVPVAVAAARLGVSVETVRRWIRSKKLPSRKDGGRYLVGLERHEERGPTGGWFFVAFNPLTGLGAYLLVRVLFPETSAGVIAGIAIYAIFIGGLLYAFGAATRGPRA